MANEDLSWNTVEALLQSVETEDGRPIVLSRYGYHIRTIEGKNYLVASTKKELVDRLLDFNKGKTGFSRIEILGRIEGDATPHCIGSWPKCIPFNGCQKCQQAYIGNRHFYCECTHK